MTDPIRAALARVPDEPVWVDTRGMLLTGRASASVFDTGLVISLASRALVSVVGTPPPAAIQSAVAALAGDVNVLCPLAAAPHVRAALAGWHEQQARLHALPGPMDWEREPDRAVIFEEGRAPDLAHVDDPLRSELEDALQGRPAARFVPGALPPVHTGEPRRPAPLAVVMIDGRAAAFCYPVLETESLWDVSVDTLPAHRGRGLAADVVRTMVRCMRGRGKAPVWGALESNAASLAVARRLGFIERGRISVFAST